MSAESKPLKIAAVADLHYTKTSKGLLEHLFVSASREADVLLLGGDLTDYGLEEEAQVLAEDLRSYATKPVLAVLGNHDYESGHPEVVAEVLTKAGVHMLEGESCEIGGVGFAGVCGFGGGFGQRMLNAWGEPLIKTFVQEALDHSMRLERALARLGAVKRVALLHYAPIRETVEGECPELFPFLGSTRLEGPLNRFNVEFAVHGHAHNGGAEGRTSTGVLVCNVSRNVLKRSQPDGPGYRIFEVIP